MSGLVLFCLYMQAGEVCASTKEILRTL